jgi:nucleoside-diphosphate-sugar epimerase
MAVYVVTGGAGFIGSNIVQRLAEEGQEVRVVDDLATGHRENLKAAGGAARLFEGSVTEGALLRRAFAGADYVLHQGALASVPRSVADPLATNAANVEGTLQVLEAARACGVRRVVYASSSSVYGDAPTLPKREDMTPQPKSPYAVSKLAGEYYCQVYNSVYGLETVSLRYFNVFGPRQDPASQYAAVVPIFIRCIVAGQAPKVYGDGEQSRDFTYVDDVVTANLQAAQAEGAAGAVCNLGRGERHTLNELLEILQDIIGRRVKAAYGPDRAGDVKHSMADITRAREAFGYEPQVTFEEGLRRTVEWYRRATA